MSKTLEDINAQYSDSQFFLILEKKYRNLSENNLEKRIEFEQEVGLFDNMQEIKDELLLETKDIAISMNTKAAVNKYSEEIEGQIEKRARYRNNQKKLDYKLVRRFLWTAFNNLHELDLSIIKPNVRILSNHLREMAKSYNDFTRKTKYPSLAYDEIFLAKQSEYTQLKKNTEKIVKEVQRLRVSERYLADKLKKCKKVLEQMKDSKKTPKYKELLQKSKNINGSYTDSIHFCSILREKNIENRKKITSFDKRYKDEFTLYFEKTAVVYEKAFTDILGAMAFELDKVLWENAKESSQIRDFFENSSVNGEFNTKTYLKYYLESAELDDSLEERQGLLELYEYLNTLHIESILIVANNVNDAIEYKQSIVKVVGKSKEVVSFTDEKLALKWAFQNSVKVLIIHDTLQNMRLEHFCDYYTKYSLEKSQVVLLGKDKKIKSKIIKTLNPDIMPHVLAKHVKELIDKS